MTKRSGTVGRRVLRRPTVALAACFVLGACASGTSVRTPTGGAKSHPHSEHEPVFGGQYSVDEALARPAPTGADARALRILSRGELPTADEVHGAADEMADISAHPDVSPGDAGDAAQIARDLAAARKAAARWSSGARAAKAGFELASRFLPGIGAHWIDWSRVAMPFDASRPSMLLFEADRSNPDLVGLSYYTRSKREPKAFTAAGARWHRHFGLCIVHGVLVSEGITDPSDCADGAGTLLPGRDLWMLHVWVVPGHENPLGTYAALNSSLCSATLPCTPDGSIPNGAPAGVSTTSTVPSHVHLDYDRPRAHAPVGGNRAWKVNPLVVEVSAFPRTAKPTKQQRNAAATLARKTMTTLRRYRTLEAARAAGYVPLPEDPIHWYQPDYLGDGRILDPEAPEFLVYVDPQQPTQQLRSDDAESLTRRVVVGAMYWMPDATSHGPQVGGPLTVWHLHDWSPGFGCGEASGFPTSSPVDGSCVTGVPIPRSAEMLHVWGVPTPDGRFSTSMEFLADPSKVLRTGYLE